MDNFNIWQGVYASFNEAPGCGKGFEEKDILAAKIKKFREEFLLEGRKKTISEILSYGESLLPFLTGLLAQEGKVVHILDFGGGLGETYLKTKNAISPHVKIQYVIVDQEGICQAGKKIFKGHPDLRFVTAIPAKFQAQIVHIGSALQYIESWSQMLIDLSKCCKGYFLFTDLPAGDVPTYVSTQYYYGSRMPCWFFNINDFLKRMNTLGYQLLMRSKFNAKILGKHQSYPQDNFESKYRLGNSCNLVFKKKK